VLFPTLDYLFFLGLTVFLYWGVPRGYRMLVLGLSSIGFYASWSIVYLPIMLLVVGIAWAGGLWIYAWRRYAGRGLRLFAVNALLLLPLFFFKYWNWGADTFLWLFREKLLFAVPDIHLRVELPIGISFFCFMSLSYVVDVYRRTIPACRSYLNYLTYISFFPHLVAGPIVRGRDLLPHL
jgi:D-alanyl-lipoteichoic acid acyltransferase DltB (MBOAT superfamily)